MKRNDAQESASLLFVWRLAHAIFLTLGFGTDLLRCGPTAFQQFRTDSQLPILGLAVRVPRLRFRACGGLLPVLLSASEKAGPAHLKEEGEAGVWARRVSRRVYSRVLLLTSRRSRFSLCQHDPGGPRRHPFRLVAGTDVPGKSGGRRCVTHNARCVWASNGRPSRECTGTGV